MNNDMANFNHINAKNVNAMPNSAKVTKTISNDNVAPNNIETVKDSMSCLEAFGHAKVMMDKNMSDSVKQSTEELFEDREFVESHVDFCDRLVERGYDLGDAIRKTDDVFEILSQEDTYKE